MQLIDLKPIFPSGDKFKLHLVMICMRNSLTHSPDTFSREVKKERIAETYNVQMVDEKYKMIMLG